MLVDKCSSLHRRLCPHCTSMIDRSRTFSRNNWGGTPHYGLDKSSSPFLWPDRQRQGPLAVRRVFPFQSLSHAVPDSNANETKGNTMLEKYCSLQAASSVPTSCRCEGWQQLRGAVGIDTSTTQWPVLHSFVALSINIPITASRKALDMVQDLRQLQDFE